MKNLKEFFRSKTFGLIAIITGLLGLVAACTLALTFEGYLSEESVMYIETPGDLSGWNYLSYFTVLTNVAVDIWLILLGISRIRGVKSLEQKITAPLLQGGMALSIFIVGFIYWGVLFWFIPLYSWHLWWGNIIDFWHHAFIPIFMTILWFCPMDERKIDRKKIYIWLIYPIAYFVFSMVRGAIIGWYPYPFLDVNDELLTDLPLNPYVWVCAAVAVLTGVFYGFGRLAIHIRNKRVGS